MGLLGPTTIKKCGGITVVQDPKDAAYPDMLQSALNNSKEVDHCVPAAEMGRLLEKLTRGHSGKTNPSRRIFGLRR